MNGFELDLWDIEEWFASSKYASVIFGIYKMHGGNDIPYCISTDPILF